MKQMIWGLIAAITLSVSPLVISEGESNVAQASTNISIEFPPELFPIIGIIIGRDGWIDSGSGDGLPVIHGHILPGPTSGNFMTFVRDTFLPKLTNFVYVLILAVSVVIIIWAGIMYITSAGDTERTNKARDTIIWALIGIAIATVSFGLIRLLVGLSIFK